MKPRPPVPDDLTLAEKHRLWAWVLERYPHLSAANVRREVDLCLSHHRATGNRRGYKDFEAACRNWIVKAERYRDARREARPELPFEVGARDNVIDLSHARRGRT